MMAAIIGREKIDGAPARLLGFELVVQKTNDISNEIIKTAPIPASPRQIVEKAFDKNFELYIIRPRINGVTFGTIWQIKEKEYQLVREWELLDFGMQQNIHAIAVGSKNTLINVVTHGTLNRRAFINRTIEGNDYDNYLVMKDKILKVATRVREEYLARLSK